jgi:hypothetical protein
MIAKQVLRICSEEKESKEQQQQQHADGNVYIE